MTERLTHPASWRGDDLLGREDWLHTLGPAEIEELDAVLQRLPSSSVEANTTADFPLPTLGARLGMVQHSLEHGSGAAMLRGFPVERYTEDQCKQLFWGLTQYIGTPVSQTAQGERIFSVRDERYALQDPRARGPNTSKKLSFHTDRCDVIAFLCLQPLSYTHLTLPTTPYV